MEHGRDHDDEFGGPDVPQENYILCKANKEMLQNYHNIGRSDSPSLVKGIILNKINEAYIEIQKRYQHVLN